MKALLFALMLLAFMGKDPVNTLKCYRCGMFYCKFQLPCLNSDDLCFTVIPRNGKQILFTTNGCTKKCPRAGPRTKVKCCSTDFCN
ncbi:three-fingered toxin-10 [Crotalus adamanteus]|uniref:Three-fingered toxin-05 n=1 Tax=Crotalus adamanteus TaxID=8729 RepID=A0AAW1BL01_CROAD